MLLFGCGQYREVGMKEDKADISHHNALTYSADYNTTKVSTKNCFALTNVLHFPF
jgi:hypothetical protein